MRNYLKSYYNGGKQIVELYYNLLCVCLIPETILCLFDNQSGHMFPSKRSTNSSPVHQKMKEAAEFPAASLCAWGFVTGKYLS